MPTHDRPRLFYGWVILAGAFCSFATAAGLMHAYTVFFVAFLDEFGWSRAETSVAYAVSQLLSGASAPFVGMLSDRLGPRTLVLLGGSVLAGGLAASAFVSSFRQLIVVYGVVMTSGRTGLGWSSLSRYSRAGSYAIAAWRSPWSSPPMAWGVRSPRHSPNSSSPLWAGGGPILSSPSGWPCSSARWHGSFVRVPPPRWGSHPMVVPPLPRACPGPHGSPAAPRSGTGGWRRQSARPISGYSLWSTCARA